MLHPIYYQAPPSGGMRESLQRHLVEYQEKKTSVKKSLKTTLKVFFLLQKLLITEIVKGSQIFVFILL